MCYKSTSPLWHSSPKPIIQSKQEKNIKHTQTEEHSTKYLTNSNQNHQTYLKNKNKDTRRNCHRPTLTKETDNSNAKWQPGLDPRTREKGYQGKKQ